MSSVLINLALNRINDLSTQAINAWLELEPDIDPCHTAHDKLAWSDKFRIGKQIQSALDEQFALVEEIRKNLNS